MRPGLGPDSDTVKFDFCMTSTRPVRSLGDLKDSDASPLVIELQSNHWNV